MLGVYLSIVSAVGLILMGFDKLSAKVASERVPELWFLLISLAGGFTGVLVGVFIFHHKVNKPTFQFKIGIGAAISILILVILVRGR